jgi:hypothetical protein
MKPVYVNGVLHKSIRDAIITTGGNETAFRKALSCGLPYYGYSLSRDPPEPEEEPKRKPGSALIHNPKVTP